MKAYLMKGKRIISSINLELMTISQAEQYFFFGYHLQIEG